MVVKLNKVLKSNNLDLESRLEHKLPVNKLVISASHNILSSRTIADSQIMKKAAADVQRGSSCISHNFIRAADDDIDENKALMPIYGNVPMVAQKIIHRILQGLDVSVVGSEEVGLVVDELQRYLGVGESRLVWVEEGKTLAENISKGISALNLSLDESVYFEPGDTPLFWDIESALCDPDLINYDCVADLNGRQSIFPNVQIEGTEEVRKELFPRNYYWLFTDDSGNVIETKEPNLWGFSSEFQMGIINEVYSNRQGGKMNAAKILGMLGLRFVSHMHTYSASTWKYIGKNIYNFLKKKFFNSESKLEFSSTTVEELGYALTGKRIKFKADHSDPFRLKDVDAWHDLWYYQHIIDEVKRRYPDSPTDGLEYIIPHAEHIKEFDKQMSRVKSKIGVLKDFKGYANRRAKELGFNTAPFSRTGRLLVPVSSGEDVGASVDYLSEKLVDYNNKDADSGCADIFKFVC